ncbi:MAG TPA: carboxypeptidase M32 [candidate division Zixibacteria bacterium]|nr:carboxypeptidase M32 [candidate division Zixibacteria bacterium]HOD67129.1 carboxypeptidase M32 [candidate division Zixibacteria bacterium]HOZ07808.1 carboxypeptidase M32 [candidate division Zixibacteria bacterium]HPC10822.1 carboxypeptidase M32 [candidate division Zixibacteria bacterium]HPM36862.1 carboxypeptidase M32 [candidate division Zixibacteria bacterium]
MPRRLRRLPMKEDLMSAQAVYDELTRKLREMALLSSAGSVLHWDQQTYMPPEAAQFRADQLGTISGLVHRMFTDPKIGDMIGTVENSDLAKGDTPEAANIRELRHDYDKMTKLPNSLVEELTRTTAMAQQVWAEARRKSDFAMFLPHLEKVLALTRRKADAYGWKDEPYNALIDDYEPGANVREVGEVFESLRKELVVLNEKIRNAPRKPDHTIVEREYEVERQKVFGESVATAMGFNFRAGRLDITTHPFCTGIGYGDTRILTRYNPNRLNDALFGIMHEAGHGLYEAGLLKSEYYGTPMAESVSLGIHESQSRMWENQVGRSKSFWKYFFPQAQRLFRKSLGDVTLDRFYGAINYVTPSYIRVEADEATYNLHILLRFEIERALLTGDMKPADAASEWNARFEKYFGLKVDKDAHGVLQDVHWSAGLVGYFPTYTLGNLYSAMFFAQARKEMPDLDLQFERGELLPLREWLREKIHRHGRRYRANELCRKITGKSLDYKPLVVYMTEKYSEIYGF